MQRIQAIHLIIIIALLQACAQIGFAPPQTTEDKIMTAYASVGAAYTTIGDLAKRKAITRDLGLRMISRADDAKKLIDNAALLLTTSNTAQAEQSLAFAVTILKALETELKTQQEKK